MAISWTEETLPKDAAGTATLPVRVYRHADTKRAAPLVFHLHGGAFTGGSVASGEQIASLLAEAGAVVISVGYPVNTCECPFPYALQATFHALNHLHKNRTNWVAKKSGLYVAGEEAGGNIAAGLALMARDQHEPLLAGQILLSPMLDPDLATKSFRQAQAGAGGCKWADGWNSYLGTVDKALHPYAAPANASRLAGLPPTLILTCPDDPMRDESLRYADRLRKSGVYVQDQIVTSADHWPEALSQDTTGEADWAPLVQRRFTEFFAHS
ncbi:alpha/beta hydrolase [Lacibacterium aquatile]|uniref:Alpha/beta hydrolase n=1 Tax=Lacibacterium aquatile TaxID=1168082 RepID=A0ABW5DXL5_9PROT